MLCHWNNRVFESLLPESSARVSPKNIGPGVSLILSFELVSPVFYNLENNTPPSPLLLLLSFVGLECDARSRQHRTRRGK